MNWEKLLSPVRLRPSKRPSEQGGQQTNDIRNPFESDFGRVVFSPATRRMHDKTQVFPLTADDNTHSRLTHSLEVMAIGYSLGIRVSKDAKFQKETGKSELQLFREVPIIVQSACLVHDIGNPPFGHFGEKVIQTYFKKRFLESSANGMQFQLSNEQKEDFTHFDGNAQGFRVLTKLQILDDDKGLNLTSATLGTYLKYPNPGAIDAEKISKKKRGVFQSEVMYLNEVADNCGLVRSGQIMRHPLCYLMEAADSICYLVMDLEDGFNKGWYKYREIKESLVDIEGMQKQFLKIEEENNTTGIEVSRVAALRIYLLQRLVEVASKNFIDNFEKIVSGEYNDELIKDDPTGLAKRLWKFSWNSIFTKKEITSLELTGHSVISGLLDYFIDFIFHEFGDYRRRGEGLISNGIRRVALLENGLSENESIDKLDDYFKLRIIVDYISGMTDQFALNIFQKLSGQRIS